VSRLAGKYSVQPLRQFSVETEALAAVWRHNPMTADAWRPDLYSAEGDGFLVTSGAARGYAKPFQKAPNGRPYAAHEKIASDLAFDLGLPVPPCRPMASPSAFGPGNVLRHFRRPVRSPHSMALLLEHSVGCG
jgi:hypothetical protein